MLTRLVAVRAAPLRASAATAARCIASSSAPQAAVSPALDERPAAARLDAHQALGGSFDSRIAPEALTIARQHPQTHGIPVGILQLRSYDPASLTLFVHFVLHAAYAFGIPASRAAALPMKRSLYTVIRSPFVHKKSQENFERIIHRRAIKLWDTDMEVFNKWARYLEINALGGVDMRFVRWERVELGFGEKRLGEVVRHEQALWEKSQQGGKTSRQQMSKVAQDIIDAELEASRAVDEVLASLDPRFQPTPSSSRKPAGTSKDGTSSEAAALLDGALEVISEVPADATAFIEDVVSESLDFTSTHPELPNADHVFLNLYKTIPAEATTHSVREAQSTPELALKADSVGSITTEPLLDAVASSLPPTAAETSPLEPEVSTPNPETVVTELSSEAEVAAVIEAVEAEPLDPSATTTPIENIPILPQTPPVTASAESTPATEEVVVQTVLAPEDIEVTVAGTEVDGVAEVLVRSELQESPAEVSEPVAATKEDAQVEGTPKEKSS